MQLHLFNYLGNGGLTSPGRHRRRTTRSGDLGGVGSTNYGTYGGGGIGNTAAATNAGHLSAVRSNSMMGGNVQKEPGTNGALNQNTPLMTGNVLGDTSAGSIQSPLQQSDPGAGEGDGFAYKAKALYACTCDCLCWFMGAEPLDRLDTASPEDPNEISFSKGEVLEILDNAGAYFALSTSEGGSGILFSNTGKWWQARKGDGSRGSQ